MNIISSFITLSKSIDLSTTTRKRSNSTNGPSPRSRSNSNSNPTAEESPRGRGDDVEVVCIDASKRSGFRDEHYEDDKGMAYKAHEADELIAWDHIETPDSAELSSLELKFLIRKGIPDSRKEEVWKAVTGCSEYVKANPNFYSEVLTSVFGAKVPSRIRHLPTFGGIVSPSDHHLVDDAFDVLKRLLCVIATVFPDIEYCPSIPDLVQVCLMFLSEADTFAVVNLLVETSRKNSRHYLNANKKECTVFLLTFNKLIQLHLPRLYKHMSSLGIEGSQAFADVWFSRLFVSYLPYQTMLRVFDIFMNEGNKIFYKVGLAILKLNTESLMHAHCKQQFLRVLQYVTTHLYESDKLIKTAFTFQFSNKHTQKLDKSHGHMIQHIKEPQMPIYYRPRIRHSSSIIDDEQFEVMWAWIPHRYCIQDPVLVFSTERNGFSLHTMIHLCAKSSPLLIIVKSNHNAIFGAYLTDPWVKSAEEQYYGQRESFLWTLEPHAGHWGWTGNNDYFMRTGLDFICVGGGTASGNGLWINDDLDGRSCRCDTFDNPQLDPISEFFHCVAIEVYTFE